MYGSTIERGGNKNEVRLIILHNGHLAFTKVLAVNQELDTVALRWLA